MQYRKKPVVIEAVTFDELVQHGRDHDANIVNGVPWSFKFNGHPITHENDECYLIPTLEGVMRFTPKDMLIVGVKGEIYPCKLDIFGATYDSVAGTDNLSSQDMALKASAGLWDAFLQIDKTEVHPDDTNDVRRHVNAIQNILYTQKWAKDHPETNR